MYATCDESDGTGNDVEGKAVIPETTASTAKTIKSSIPLKSEFVDKTRNVDQSPSYGMSRHFSKSSQKLLGVDVTNAVSCMAIDDDQNAKDVKIKTKKRKGSKSPGMVPPVSKSPRLELIESNPSNSLGGLVREKSDYKFFVENTRSLQTLDSAFASIDSYPPIQKEEMYNIGERKMNNNKENVMRKFINSRLRSMRALRDFGLVHSGDSMGQVTWIPLGGKDVEFPGDIEENNNDLFIEGVGRRTRASNRVRNSLGLLNTGTEFRSIDFVNEVYEFQANDDDDFVEEDISEDPDFGVKRDKSKQGKGRGKGKKSEKTGGGQGRLRKSVKVENNSSIVDFYSPVETKATEEEKMISETGDMSPLTAACYRPGLSGYNQQSLRSSSHRSESVMGECPLCRQKFAMVLLENHASSCEG